MSKCADFFILVAAAAVLAAGCGSPAAGPGGPGGNGGGGSGAGGSTDVDAAPRGGSGGSRLDAGQDATVVLSDAPVSVDQMPDAGPDFCDSYAAQACQRLVACSQPYVTAVYGDMTTCQDRVRLLCVTEAVLPGTGLNRATMAACQAALPGASCDDLFARAVTACQMKGTLATGAACGSGSQCQSGFCRTPETSFCGKCAASAAEGAPCDTSESCEFPLLCSETGHCVKASGEGELCNESKPCKGGALLCRGQHLQESQWRGQGLQPHRRGPAAAVRYRLLLPPLRQRDLPGDPLLGGRPGVRPAHQQHRDGGALQGLGQLHPGRLPGRRQGRGALHDRAPG